MTILRRGCWIMLIGAAVASVATAADEPRPLGEAERRQFDDDLRGLKERLAKLKPDDRRADAEVFAKGLEWSLRFDDAYLPADVKLMKKAVERARARVASLEGDKPSWTSRKGKVVRGFVSAVDGSVQPYGVIVPAGYGAGKPTRLDVVLHGSTKPLGVSELRFMGRFDEGDDPAASAPEADFIELHPLGRVENGYRWAGETDVYEAIDAACRQYNIDRDRIVLRGMSMGASGTWHLGLKRPDRFVALGPYCGYVDTHEFSKTPLANFVVVNELPDAQEKMLHMLDSVDYAANAGEVPCIACMGDKDVFFEAHEIMGRAMGREGLTMVNLISRGTGHVIDPVVHKEQMRRLGEYAARGIDHAPGHVRFVTWTLKYSRSHWLEILGMGEHYARAEIEGRAGDGGVVLAEPTNVTRLAVHAPVAAKLLNVRVGDARVAIPRRDDGKDHAGVVLGKADGRWSYLGDVDGVKPTGKRPGVQGPIDDAFTSPFLCVRGTGTPWNPAVQAWADARLKQFDREWSRYFRGELPVKDDADVTPEDIRTRHLILFGDPGSNALMARILPDLPVRWTREECRIGDAAGPAADHALKLIQPNPLAEGRYVVFNSGHTFGEKELSTLNYLLFPRLGDWAVVRVTEKGEEAIVGGFFDEGWAPPARDARLK